MAIDGPTIPGRQATFATCCRLLSFSIAGINSSSANTSPSVSIGPVRGTRQR